VTQDLTPAENELIRLAARALQAAADGDEDAVRAALAHLDPDLAGEVSALLTRLMRPPDLLPDPRP
jgi:hypothetical protein